jgi:hypothetical protein
MIESKISLRGLLNFVSQASEWLMKRILRLINDIDKVIIKVVKKYWKGGL